MVQSRQAGEMDHWLRAPTVLVEELSLHTAKHSYNNTDRESFPGCLKKFWEWEGMGKDRIFWKRENLWFSLTTIHIKTTVLELAMTQVLQIFPTLPEVSSLISSIPVWWLTTICNSSSRSIQHPLLASAGIYTHIHTSKHINKQTIVVPNHFSTCIPLSLVM